ncbi:MAG TPA: hypothetical protein VLU25_12815 [Acidobacteriota bacterium]|nr:hypothetical protein [Acidobacteriota bacterium]
MLLYNPAAWEARLVAFFSFADGRQWTLPVKSVAANSFAEIDLEQLRQQGASDHFQRVIPQGEVQGQVKILQKGKPAEKLLIQTVLDDRPSGRSLLLESCPLCLSQPSQVAFIPGSQLSGLVGETLFVPPLIAFFADGHTEDVTFFSDIRSLNTSVAQVSAFSAHLVGPGSTAIEGEYEDPFFEIDPLCIILAGALVATVVVLSEEVPEVTIADLESVPKNGTASVQVSLSNSLSEHSVSLTLSRMSGTGTARFESTNSTTMNLSSSRSVSIKGVTESSTADNIALKAAINGQALAQENFSVVWVTLSFRHGSGATVSQDNAARSQYVATLGTSSLGLFRSGGETARDFDGWHTGVEVVGTVEPSNYQGRIVLNRTVNRRIYGNDCDLTQPFQGDDTSDDRLRDDAPQSGGSNGKVYDLDAPGPAFLKNTPFGIPIGTQSRSRQNFTEWATLEKKAKDGGSRVSDSLSWFSRVSIIMTVDGAALLNDAIRDNRAGTGNESLNCK